MTTTTAQVPPVPTASNPVRTRGRAICQYANALPAEEDGWTVVSYLAPQFAEDGWAPVLGSASFRVNYGVIKRANYPRWLSWGAPLDNRWTGVPHLLSGLWCRILVSDPAGPISLGSGNLVETFRAVWYGTFGDDDDSFGNQGNRDVSGVVSIGATGILGVLEDVWASRGFAKAENNDIVDSGDLMVFNGSPDDTGTLFGNRSAGTHAIRETRGTAHVFLDGSGTLWTARNAVEHLLECYTRQANTALRFVLAAETGGNLDTLLGYSERWDLRGLNIYQMLTRLINSRRGLGFRASVSGATITIHVDSGFAAPITVGALVIPANRQVFDLDVRGAQWLHAPRLLRDTRNVVDELILEGDPEISVHTLEFRANAPRLSDTGHGELVLAFSAADATTWDTLTDDQKKSPLYEWIWREINLASDWDGSPSIAADPLTGLANRYDTSNTTADLVHGEGGIIGLARAISGSAPIPPPAGVLRFEKLLPLFSGFNYFTANDATAQAMSATRSLIAPMVFYSATGSAPWVDLSDEYQLTMLPGRAGFQLGSSAGASQAAIKTLLSASGAKLLVTIAIAGPFAMKRSWKRAANTLPRSDRPRTIAIPIPGMQQWWVTKGTVLGIDAAGALIKRGTDLLARDDGTLLDQVLALSLPWQTQPRVELSWTERDIIDDSDTKRVGSLCNTLIRGDKTEVVTGVVIRRRYDFAAWTTARTTQRPLIDVGAIL